MDLTYIPMARGFVYLCAVVDWVSRKVLSRRLPITMEAASMDGKAHRGICLRRAALAVDQIRGDLPSRLQDRVRSPRWLWSISDLDPTPTFIP